MICHRIGFPPISTIGFGRRVVSSDSRVPHPPARITAFMLISSLIRLQQLEGIPHRKPIRTNRILKILVESMLQYRELVGQSLTTTLAWSASVPRNTILPLMPRDLSYKYGLKSDEWTIFKSEQAGHYLAPSASPVRTLPVLAILLLNMGHTHRDIDIQTYCTDLPWYAPLFNSASSRSIGKIYRYPQRERQLSFLSCIKWFSVSYKSGKKHPTLIL
jgi:hypothetical protein